MSDDVALLRTIFSDLHDLMPRRVFADWLEEHGDSDRAEHTRLYCESRGQPPGSRRSAMEERMQAIWKEHLSEWDVQYGQALIRDEATLLIRQRIIEGRAWNSYLAANPWQSVHIEAETLDWNWEEGRCPSLKDCQLSVTQAVYQRVRRMEYLQAAGSASTEPSGDRLLLFYPRVRNYSRSRSLRWPPANPWHDYDGGEPPPDTWLWFCEDANAVEPRPSLYLLALVPPERIDQVNRAIEDEQRHSSDDLHSLDWATDVENWLTRKLRDVDLLF
jgi:uncharacterized protein (TIGR02996 family)